MKIYAISDLHLSFSSNKPMDIFGKEWIDHDVKIRENWLRDVSPEDVVVIPGDISWGMRKTTTQEDFRWIHELPGTKVLFKGNHDLWWTTSKKLNALYDDMFFIQNTYYAAGGIAICGTRGWNMPESALEWSTHDEKIYQRELGRLRMSLEAAKRDGREHYCRVTLSSGGAKKSQDGIYGDTGGIRCGKSNFRTSARRNGTS